MVIHERLKTPLGRADRTPMHRPGHQVPLHSKILKGTLSRIQLNISDMTGSDTLRSRLTQLLSTETTIYECRQCGTTCTSTDTVCPTCNAPEIATYHF